MNKAKQNGNDNEVDYEAIIEVAELELMLASLEYNPKEILIVHFDPDDKPERVMAGVESMRMQILGLYPDDNPAIIALPAGIDLDKLDKENAMAMVEQLQRIIMEM